MNIRPSIKNVFAVPLPNHFQFRYPKRFLAHLENNFFCPIFIRKSLFSHYAAMKEKTNMQKMCYLPTQRNIQGRGTANKQFFKDGLTAKLQIYCPDGL